MRHFSRVLCALIFSLGACSVASAQANHARGFMAAPPAGCVGMRVVFTGGMPVGAVFTTTWAQANPVAPDGPCLALVPGATAMSVHTVVRPGKVVGPGLENIVWVSAPGVVPTQVQWLVPVGAGGMPVGGGMAIGKVQNIIPVIRVRVADNGDGTFDLEIINDSPFDLSPWTDYSYFVQVKCQLYSDNVSLYDQRCADNWYWDYFSGTLGDWMSDTRAWGGYPPRPDGDPLPPYGSLHYTVEVPAEAGTVVVECGVNKWNDYLPDWNGLVYGDDETGDPPGSNGYFDCWHADEYTDLSHRPPDPGCSAQPLRQAVPVNPWPLSEEKTATAGVGAMAVTCLAAALAPRFRRRRAA